MKFLYHASIIDWTSYQYGGSGKVRVKLIRRVNEVEWMEEVPGNLYPNTPRGTIAIAGRFTSEIVLATRYTGS